jgi:hypothetical protein
MFQFAFSKKMKIPNFVRMNKLCVLADNQIPLSRQGSNLSTLVPYNLPTVFPGESRAPTLDTPRFSSSRLVHIANLCSLPSTSEHIIHYLSFSAAGSEKIIAAFPHRAELLKRRENNSTDTGITVLSLFVRKLIQN